ncbi:MAG: nitroreductase family protein, partial [Clostridia bacterium]|nr:nitroreductase family protein [Clostridia bacterium]
VASVQRLNARVSGDEERATFYGAPTVVVVFGDKNSRFCLDDGNLVISNVLNAAHALGVDSCYIWRARECFASEEGKALMKKWGVPDNYIGVGNVILGYGVEGGIRPAKERKSDYVIKIG